LNEREAARLASLAQFHHHDRNSPAVLGHTSIGSDGVLYAILSFRNVYAGTLTGFLGIPARHETSEATFAIGRLKDGKGNQRAICAHDGFDRVIERYEGQIEYVLGWYVHIAGQA
jgi:hypothetical protein